MAARGGYAHFPGGGPTSATCRDCRFSQSGRRYDKGECEKAREILNGKFAGFINLFSGACKYFEEIPDAPAKFIKFKW